MTQVQHLDHAYHGSVPATRGRLALLGVTLCALATSMMALPARAYVPNEIYVNDCSLTPDNGGNDGPVTANVVAMDQVITYNRMGAFAPAGMIFALARDVFPKLVLDQNGNPVLDQNGDPVPFAGPFNLANSCETITCNAGEVMLRPDKRPRPLTLRVNEGCQIGIKLTNLLTPFAGQVTTADPVVEDALNEAPGINLCEPNVPAFDRVGVEFPPRAPSGTDPTDPEDPLGRTCLSEQPATRNVSIHVHGMIPDAIDGIANDGSNVGENATKQPPGGNSLVAPNDSHTYVLTAKREGAYTITSGPNLGGEGGSGAIASGLFGVLNVEPAGSVWYRSQVTREDMLLASTATTGGGHPILDYNAKYPAGHPYAGKPILKILDADGNIFHNVLNAVIDGEMQNDSGDYELYPDRGEPFREHTIVFHDEVKMVQAFPEWYKTLAFTLGGVKDGFAVNYGTGGVGSEVIGNRLGVGPMHECAECKYEEFFLTSWAVGDPAMIVDIPANQGLELCDPALNNCENVGPKATRAFYADDPANVHHGYLNDRTKIRNIHVGTEHHIFHMHAHQWNFVNRDEAGSKGSDQTNYLDSQGIGPGSSFTYEITFGGGGNRHKTPGDSIFHCHFYPHFAQGMWGLWRVHDTFEEGSLVDDNGRVEVRGLPDSEICVALDADGVPNRDPDGDPDGNLVYVNPKTATGNFSCGGYTDEGVALAGGTPVPGVVPLPGSALAPMPGTPFKPLVVSVNNTKQHDAVTADEYESEEAPFVGFPFYIAGKAGHRPPTPPLDLIVNGGLPRHVITGGTVHQFQTATDFQKELVTATGYQLPETGTKLERVAMAFHGPQTGTGHAAFHATWDTLGNPAGGMEDPESGFEVNGLPPAQGAPFAEPCRGDAYNAGIGTYLGQDPRFYAASVIELPVQLNKVGWHFFQQRLIVLDGDVADTLNGTRAPEPFVMRANSGDCIDFNHTNLVPSVYQLDDYQVRTPTDVIGQHIHLVKFDVTSADGAANGWNYEDATLSPDEVHERLVALTAPGGVWTRLPEASTLATNCGEKNWNCARTTRQKWYADPGWLSNVFTHDHLGPSTHQQAGLYGTLLIEPKNSEWRDPAEEGVLYGSRPDGGPTSWRADIIVKDDVGNVLDAYREFYLEFGDFQLAYRNPDTIPGSTLTGDGAGDGPTNFNAGNQAVNPSYRNEPEPRLPHVLESKVAAVTLPGTEIDEGVVTHLDVEIKGCGQGQGANSPEAPYWTGCQPEAISAADPGTFVVNMRNEPIALRVRDPLNNEQHVDPVTGGIAQGGDLSYAFSSLPVRADPRLNLPVEDWPYGRQTATQGALTGDPFTPLLRAYEGDKVVVKVQVGAHEEGHNFSINGINWLQNWRSGVSGFRNSQFMGISEYFFFQVPSLGAVSTGEFEDYLYQTGSSTDARWNGSWGLLRAYDGEQGLQNDPALGRLNPLPTNPDGKVRPMKGVLGKFCSVNGTIDDTRTCRRDRDCGQGNSCVSVNEPSPFNGVCPADAPVRTYDIVAVRGADVLPNLQGDTTDPRGDVVYNNKAGRELWDPTGLLYVLKSDLESVGGKWMLRKERRVEPLILRAAAGECLNITLTNWFGAAPLELQDFGFEGGYNTLPMIVHHFNNNQIRASENVGLHAQLVAYDVADSDGMNVGRNPPQTAGLDGIPVKYKWYAGRVEINEGVSTGGNRTAVPMEYGAINLMASDPIKGSNKGLIGALVVEPAGTFWRPDGERGTDTLLTRAAVTIYDAPAACSHDATVACERDTDCVEQLPGQCSRSGTACSSNADCGRRGDRCELPPPTVETCVYPTSGKKFRDFVVVHQDDVNLLFKNGDAGVGPLPTVSHEEEPEDSGGKGINYRTDPIWHRLGKDPTAVAATTRAWDYTEAFSSSLGEPQTPVFTTKSGETDQIRLRVLKPGGHNRNHVVTLHGFVWPRYPYSNDDRTWDEWYNANLATGPDERVFNDSQRIDPTNTNTFWHGEQMGHGPSNHINVVPVGGCPADGDFLYRDMVPVHIDNGQWAIVRCGPDDEVPPPPQ